MSKPTISQRFTREEMESELREILFIQASQIAHAGSQEAATLFLSFDYEFSPVSSPTEADYEKIDLNRFAARHYLSIAYDYAFQTGQSWGFSESDYHDLVAFRGGVTPEAVYGPISPFHAQESRCRHVIDMALGRWHLECGDGRDLTIRHLALLAGMTEAAVRNSLSTEQIRTQGKPAALSPDMAIQWLKGRKGFVKTHHEANTRAVWTVYSKQLLQRAGFFKGLRALLSERPLTALELADQAHLPLSTITDLLDGRINIGDLEALQRIANVIETDVPFFVGQAVEAGLRVTE